MENKKQQFVLVPVELLQKFNQTMMELSMPLKDSQRILPLLTQISQSKIVQPDIESKEKKDETNTP